MARLQMGMMGGLSFIRNVEQAEDEQGGPGEAASPSTALRSPAIDEQADGKQTPERNEHADAVVAAYLREHEEVEQAPEAAARPENHSGNVQDSKSTEQGWPATGHEQATEQQQEPGMPTKPSTPSRPSLSFRLSAR